MSHTTPSEAEVVNTLASLQLSTNSKPKAKPKSAPVADSWDDDVSSGSDTETESLTTSSLARTASSNKDSLSPINTVSSADGPPNPPPPTPASPTPFDYPDNSPYAYGQRSRGNSGVGNGPPDKRPEKTTAVAGRLIAGALGVRAPKRTEEEREFDKAMRAKERKRRDEERNKEKVEKEQAEERKRAIWED